MKPKTLVVSLLGFVFSVAVFFIFASCDTVTPKIQGTWVNSQYDGMLTQPLGDKYPAKQVFSGYSGESVLVKIFDTYDDTAPLNRVSADVTFELTDSEGNKYFKLWSSGLYDSRYTLFKVHADYQTLEANGYFAEYPTQISPDGPYYAIWYRP